MTEAALRDAVGAFGKSLFERGLTFGSSGNISVKMEDGWLLTPTNVSLGSLDPARLSKLDDQERHVAGDKPTKETFLHMGMYRRRENAGAVVQALDVKALRIGPQIDPGVPCTVTVGERPLALALKSGNFGGEDFFTKALEVMP